MNNHQPLSIPACITQCGGMCSLRHSQVRRVCVCVCEIAVMSFAEPVTHRQPRETLMVFFVNASEGRVTLGPTSTGVRLCRCEDVFLCVFC